MAAEENHELHMGEVTPDPWDDSEQTDWPNYDVQEVEEDGDAVGTD